MFDYVCQRCGLTWHSAAAPELTNEWGCQRCGGELRDANERPAGNADRGLKLVERVGADGDDCAA